jgi:hypothetical protein
LKAYFEKHANGLKYVALSGMMVIPFFLYFAAVNDLTSLGTILLGLMGLSMLLALKVG